MPSASKKPTQNWCVDQRFSTRGTIREREQEHIVRALNRLLELALKLKGRARQLSAAEQERARRMLYQSALLYVAHLLRHLLGRLLNTDVASHENMELRLGYVMGIED